MSRYANILSTENLNFHQRSREILAMRRAEIVRGEWCPGPRRTRVHARRKIQEYGCQRSRLRFLKEAPSYRGWVLASLLPLKWAGRAIDGDAEADCILHHRHPDFPGNPHMGMAPSKQPCTITGCAYHGTSYYAPPSTRLAALLHPVGLSRRVAQLAHS